jgi:hypothetical protein
MKKFLIALNIVIWSTVAVEAQARVSCVAMYTGNNTERNQKNIEYIQTEIDKARTLIPECNQDAGCINETFYEASKNYLHPLNSTVSMWNNVFNRGIWSKTLYSDMQKSLDSAVTKNEADQKAVASYNECEAVRKAEFDAEMSVLDAEVQKIKAEQDRLAKLPGVKLGMTAKQVRTKSSWGEPYQINRTTNRYGVREQWVYGSRNYLYFENGILTSIQN